MITVMVVIVMVLTVVETVVTSGLVVISLTENGPKHPIKPVEMYVRQSAVIGGLRRVRMRSPYPGCGQVGDEQQNGQTAAEHCYSLK